MLARFFIDRPVLAWVISVVIVLLGAIAAGFLPIAEYPEITPPTVRVTASYPGANAQVVADTVAAPIEQQVVGVEGMMYMSSQSNNDGSYTLDVTFELGTNVNMAQVLVQNRVAIAEPTLPDVVRTIGVAVKKRSPDVLLGISLYSEDNPETGRPYYDSLYLSNYATIHLKDAMARVEGVGDVAILGQQDYSMRVWLDPDKLQSRNLTVNDVIRVLREQNVQVAAGQIGQPPVPNGQDFQYTLSTLGRLVEAEQFADIILKTGSDGEVTYLRDVSRTELGARNQDTLGQLDGRPSPGVVVFLLPGSNALDTADGIKAKMRELETRFPKGLRYVIVYDTTPFIRESVNEVFHTLRDSVILVAIVILLFLQDWKALLLPVIDVAVSLVGTFAVMGLMGFTLNNLTLFGLVLAIGIVVDDAIVVLENIERWLDKGLPVREATIKAMNEITGPIFAITLVLSSVLLPSAFLGGITGQFFRQFALTISVSMIISAINAMTMTPARAAWIFAGRKPGQHGDQGKEALPWWSFALFGGLATVWLLTPTLGAWLGLPAGEGLARRRPAACEPPCSRGASPASFSFRRGRGRDAGLVLDPPGELGTGPFLPRLQLDLRADDASLRQDRGLVPPPQRHRAPRLRRPDRFDGLRLHPRPQRVRPHPGQGLPGGEHPIARLRLAGAHGRGDRGGREDRPRDARRCPHGGHPGAVVRPERQQLELRLHVRHPQAVPRTAGPLAQRRGHRGPAPRTPPARGPGGPRARLRGPGGAGPRQRRRLQADGGSHRRRQLRRAAGPGGQPGRPGQPAARPGRPVQRLPRRTPQLYADIDRTKVRTMGVALTDVFDALQAYLGSYYVNDFNRFGRTWQVNVQADAPFRVDAETVKQLKVRNADGDMVPLGAVIDVRDSAGPVTITRYNMFPAATITGSWQPGVSTGDVLRTMEALVGQGVAAHHDLRVDRAELLAEAVQQDRAVPRPAAEPVQRVRAGGGAGLLRAGRPVRELVAAAGGDPGRADVRAVRLTGVAVRGMDNNIFIQVGFVVLIGLACKNAILIVEFARDRQQEGASRFDAAVEAARVRLRPIVMTSMCFVHMVPPYFASGAGAEMRRSLGTAMLWGAFGVTLFGIFLTPVFYSVVRRLTDRKAVKPALRHETDGRQPGRRRNARPGRRWRFPCAQRGSRTRKP